MPPSVTIFPDPCLKLKETAKKDISQSNSSTSQEKTALSRIDNNKLSGSPNTYICCDKRSEYKEEAMSGSAVHRNSSTATTNGVVAKEKKYKSWDQLTPKEKQLRQKFVIWASSFVRLDPRYRIHRFFQGIAQRGELKLQDAVFQKKKRESLLADDHKRKARELLTSCFNMASVFTVWRPCSEDAIRKMMQGKGVGKGLDIKGKSAKFGRCSGYVPFLQIHNEEDKKKIDLLPRDARMRIFYTTEETRQLAVDTMEKVKEEMMETVDIDQDSMTILRWSLADSPAQQKPQSIHVSERQDSDVSALGSRDSMSMSMVRDRLRGRASDLTTADGNASASNPDSLSNSISTYPRQKSVSPTRGAILNDANDARKLKRVKSLGLPNTQYSKREGPMASASGGPNKLRSVKSFGAALGARDAPSPMRERRMGLQTVDSFAIRGNEPQSMPSSPLSGIGKQPAALALGRRPSDDMCLLDTSDTSTSDLLENGSKSDLFDSTSSLRTGLSTATMPRLETIASLGASETGLDTSSQSVDPIAPLPKLENVPQRRPRRYGGARDSLIKDTYGRNKKGLLRTMTTGSTPVAQAMRDSMISLSNDPSKMIGKTGKRENSSGSLVSASNDEGSTGGLSSVGSLSRSSSPGLMSDDDEGNKSIAEEAEEDDSEEDEAERIRMSISERSHTSVQSADSRVSLQIIGSHRKARFMRQRSHDGSSSPIRGGGFRAGRRHSLCGNPADIAMRRRESSSRNLALGDSRNPPNSASTLKTTSVVTNPQHLLGQNESASGRRTSSVMEYCVASQRRQAWEMEDPSITMIDDYIPDGRYGIEVSERLFWEAMVIRQEHHCKKWHILHPKDNTHNNNNNDLYDHGADAADLNTTRKPKPAFAEKLMTQMIVVSDRDPGNEVIEWIEDEKSWSFVIVNKDRFVNEVLWPIRRKDEEKEKSTSPDSMFPTKYSSFAGELRRCSFVEETTGSGFARFSHKLFRKDRPEFSALVGSEHDTGRDSSSSLQDANFKALRYKPATADAHRVVLFNQDDEVNPLCPHNLLMAYEEHGRVVPVVSDFDGFLVGTKRIVFDVSLPPEQLEILEGNILSAQEILEGRAMGNNWMERWLYASRDHLGQNNSRITGKKRPKMPQFGYGDAKSYRLMEGAVAQLAKVDGAVRHGAECFNYVFPQEIDQTFLVISDALGGKVRWKYVDSVKLHYFLSRSIDDGFAFPLNPKWVLCDPGWSKLYDKLMLSKVPNVQQALNVWYPPKIRKMIDQIQIAHPTGLNFSASQGGRKGKMGLPCIAKYYLGSQGQNGVLPRDPDDPGSDPESEDAVTLWIDRGSVILWSKPDKRSGLVCATNESCVPICGGVTQALTGVGGPELLEDVKALPVLWESSFGPVRCVTGSAKIVSRKDGAWYGNLDVSHVIYAVGPAYGETYSSDNDVGIKDGLLCDAYRKSLECANERGLEAVAFSLLSAGKRSSRWDPQRALRLAIRTLVDYEDYGSVKEVHMCAFTAGEVAALENIAKEFGLASAPI